MSESMFEVGHDGNGTLIKMQHGKVNAMDIEFCIELRQLLETLERESTAGVILTGNARTFSAGIDLKRWLQEGPDYVEPFLNSLEDLFLCAFRFGKPLIAAINSHAIAGGCMLANAADYRLITPQARIGIPEMRIGVPLPTTAIEIMRFVADHLAFSRIVNVGATFVGKEAVAAGLADEVVTEASMLELSSTRLHELCAIPWPAFRFTKQQIRGNAIRQMERGRQALYGQFFEIWKSNETREFVKSYVQQRLG